VTGLSFNQLEIRMSAMHNTALKITLKAVVRSLNEAHNKLESIPNAGSKQERDTLLDAVTNIVFYTSARVENVLAHFEQDIDVDAERDLQEEELSELNKGLAGEYEALFRQAES
jgi:hypothetical protein